MAVSVPHLQKRNKLVYGRAGPKAKYGAHVHGEERERSTPSTFAATQTMSGNTIKVSRTASNLPTVQRVRSRDKTVDLFDVPSSDDEATAPERSRPLTHFKKRGALVDDTRQAARELAPWEKTKAAAVQGYSPSPRESSVDAFSPGAQLRHDLVRTMQPSQSSQETTLSARKKPARRTIHSDTSADDTSRMAPTSALAGLEARRCTVESDGRPGTVSEGHCGRHGLKRSTLLGDGVDSPRKRPKLHSDSQSTEDTVMEHVGPELARETVDVSGEDKDIFAFPDSSADEDSQAFPKRTGSRSQRQKQNVHKLPGRSLLSVPARRPAKASGRAAHEIPTDSESPDPPTTSPSINNSITATPQRPLTPHLKLKDDPETAIKTIDSRTPKQATIWNRLLSSDAPDPSPSALAISDLAISGSNRAGGHSLPRSQPKSKNNDRSRRLRLVDRLKASVPTSEDNSSEDEDVDVQEDGVEDKSSQQTLHSPSNRGSQNNADVTQAPSPSKSNWRNGPRITYSSKRTYLQEDSFEDSLMLGLDADLRISSRAATLAKPASGNPSQKSDLDMTDSEDEGGGGLRTIHELRAAGRNMRAMEDIEGLLRDIENHNASNRSRRRSALVELATKLTDQTFLKRFISHSFEGQLMSECDASPDVIADFALVAAVASLCAADVSEHALSTMRSQDVVGWLCRMLDADEDVVGLAKARSSNMAKSSQASFVEFVNLVKTQPLIWEDQKPPTLSPRLIALKAMELLVKKLRQSGDKTVLLHHTRLSDILPEPLTSIRESVMCELGTAISVLELLSTTPASIAWPSDVLSRVSALLPQMEFTSSEQRHILFLTLRLCLNITNANAQNCDELATPALVQHLLQSVARGFTALHDDAPSLDGQTRTLALDLLVLSMGVMINLAEHSERARRSVATDEPAVEALIRIFRRGQTQALQAESDFESALNVAFGYLAVMLANLCQTEQAKLVIASKLPLQRLDLVVEAVEEFIAHHQKVDMMNYEGEEGAEVWGVFTEKLKDVLRRLKAVC